MNRLRSPQEAKYWLQAQGISIAYFARKHELDQATTYQVLSGTKKGFRGQAHKVAIALGIKEDIESFETSGNL